MAVNGAGGLGQTRALGLGGYFRSISFDNVGSVTVEYHRPSYVDHDLHTALECLEFCNFSFHVAPRFQLSKGYLPAGTDIKPRVTVSSIHNIF